MSVLVEALSVIISRRTLDGRYPGGVAGFLAETARPSAENRYACADRYLVSVSFFAPESVERMVILLREAGLVEAIDEQFQDFAVVDQQYGPLMSCPWLIWTRDPSGYTAVWLVGTEPGMLATPEGWSVEQSRRLSRPDLRDTPGRGMKLSEEDGRETWLDFLTGRVTKGLLPRKRRD